MKYFPTCKRRMKVCQVIAFKEKIKRGLNWLQLYVKGIWLDRLFIPEILFIIVS